LGSPLPTSTPLDIRQEASRVQHVGLKWNDLGGVFLRVPSALCGSSVFTRGKTGLLVLPLHDREVLSCIGPYFLGKYEVSGPLTDIASKVCQGVHSPKDYSRFL